jgi:hypothetical protein
MPSFTPGASKLLAFWGDIQSAVNTRASTADLWQAVRDAATAQGFDLGGANAIDMGQLRSIAVANRVAMENLAKAGSPGTLDSTMFGAELYARDQASFNAAPLYLVRFEHNVLENGEPATLWRTDTFRGFLPPTKDDLMEQLNIDAQNLGDEYNQSHVSIGAVSINVA